jgi:formamidopyrimidine-DNA glycosylase
MVEGPGVRLNAEKLRRSILNKIVVSVLGSSLDSSILGSLAGKRLNSILPLGKELFLFFLAARNPDHSSDSSEICLRLHFGMSGSALVDSTHRFRKLPVLEIRFDSGNVLRLYEATIETRNASSSRDKVERSQHLDVCSEASI